MLRWLAAALLGALLAACTRSEPIPLGFISGQTGRFADLGTAGLNGAVLAVEERNAAGGVGGRPVKLIIRDDAHDPQQAAMLFEDLLRQEVVAVIGPMTSAMAGVLIPLADRHATLLMGGTIVSHQFSGLDDQFVRVIDSSQSYAAGSARKHHQLLPTTRRISLILDLANREYTEDWARTYARAWPDQSTRIELEPFDSGRKPDLHELARQILRQQPDLVVLVSSALFSAELAKALHGLQPELRLATAGWAGSTLLIELGGSAVEGMLVEQYFIPGDLSEKYRKFSENFLARFKRAPDFGAVISYDATNVLLDTLSQHPQRSGLKEALIARGSFQGVQGPLRIDRFGDAQRQASMAIIRNHRLQAVP